MTEITFYFNAPDKLGCARVLATKALASRRKLLIYASDRGTLNAIDNLLWTTPGTGFVPHCLATDGHAYETPILLTGDPEAMPHHEILMNLDHQRPTLFSRFDRLIEIVSRDDPDDRLRARERFKFYRDRGYEIDRHDLDVRT